MAKELSTQDTRRQIRIVRLIKSVRFIHQHMHSAIQLYDAQFTFSAYKDRSLPFIVSFSRTVLGDLIFLFSQLSGGDKKLDVSRLEDYIENVFDGISYCYIYLNRYVNDTSDQAGLGREGLLCLRKYASLLEQIADAAVSYMEDCEEQRKPQVQVEGIQHEVRSDIIQ